MLKANEVITQAQSAHLDDLTLSPEQDAVDTEQLKRILEAAPPGNDNAELIVDLLEDVWGAVINCGETLRQQRCTSRRFEEFLVRSKIASSEAHLSRLIDVFTAHSLSASLKSSGTPHHKAPHSSSTSGSEEDVVGMDFPTFIKALIHVGFVLYNELLAHEGSYRRMPHDGEQQGPDHQLVLERLVNEYLRSFVTAYQQVHGEVCADGLGSDELYLQDADVDRILFQHDRPISQMFEHYRQWDRHSNRELTYEQNTILDQFIEVDELREMAKDFGFFPKYLSFYRISQIAQCACFGRVVVHPTRHVVGRHSHIGSTSEGEGLRQSRSGSAFSAEANTSSDWGTNQLGFGDIQLVEDLAVSGSDMGGLSQHDFSQSGEDTRPAGPRAENPLFISQLPSEFLHDEALLDKERFCSVLVRMAQILFNRKEYRKRLPSIASRLEVLIDFLRQSFRRVFPHGQFDVAVDPLVPVLESEAHTLSGALTPQVLPLNGGVPLTIRGRNFSTCRGVFVKFGNRANGFSKVCKCAEVAADHVVVIVPPFVADHFAVDGRELQDGGFEVSVVSELRSAVECSNDRYHFSHSMPAQIATFRDFSEGMTQTSTLQKVVIDVLRGIHKDGCAWGTKNKYEINAKFMYLVAWIHVMEKVLPLGAAIEGADQREKSLRKIFFTYASAHFGASELSLDLHGFLLAVSHWSWDATSQKSGWAQLLTAQVKSISAQR